MSKKFFIICIFLTLVYFAWSDNPVTFIKTYGASENEYSYGVEQTSDGGYILIGHTFSSELGRNSLYLVKTDANGNELWYKVFYGASNDNGPVVRQTRDGGYIILEYSSSKHPVGGVWFDDVLIIKTDSSGNELWRNVYGGDDITVIRLQIEQTADNGFIISGSIMDLSPTGTTPGDYEVYLLKLDSEGNEIWMRRYGSPEIHFYIRSIKQTLDGGYIIVGYTRNPDTYDIYLAKIDTNGNVSWEKTFNYSLKDLSICVQQTSDGGYIITGETLTAGSLNYGNFDILLIKTDSTGNEIWMKTYDINDNDDAAYVEQTSDGGYIITGRTSIEDVGLGAFLIKTDLSGNEIWTRVYHEYVLGYVYVGHQTTDGGYIFNGTTITIGAGGLDAFLIKTDSQGNVY